MKKVISFCLYGRTATYILGMKQNCVLANKYFPDWEVRIYHNNTVDLKRIKQYESLGAVCFLCENIGNNKTNWEGMLWRWFPIDDSSVDVWLSRDADSRLSEREAKIVNEWVNSGKSLHSIRDHRCHFNPIMGGMFGINNNSFRKKYTLKPVKEIIQDLYIYYKERPYNVDQIYLNETFWKTIETNDVMAHISNSGRRVYKSDIEILPDILFIGKQYRLPDFPNENNNNTSSTGTVINDSGVYWKQSHCARVFWSNCNVDVKADVVFSDANEFFCHRIKNGYPKSWSGIQIFDDIIQTMPLEEPKKEKSEKTNHLISIAISTFDANGNGATLLEYGLDSINTQTYTNIEVVISDHSVSNEIQELCRSKNGSSQFRFPIKYVSNPNQKGNISHNINNALKYCSGEYIKILFMDDYFLNCKAIENIVKEFEKKGTAKWLVHSYAHTVDYKKLHKLRHPSFSDNIIFSNKIGCPSCLTIHKSVIERFDEKIKWFMDSEFYSRLLQQHGDPVFLLEGSINDVFVVQLLHNNQVTETCISKPLIRLEREYIKEKVIKTSI
jgi:hypothetical protein